MRLKPRPSSEGRRPHQLDRRIGPGVWLWAAAALLLAGVAGYALAGRAGALAGHPGAPAGPLDAVTQTREIAKTLKCPVCQNIPVADSPSELAQQMRDVIRKKVEAGETREQILAYFAARYGDDVLLDPPRRGAGGALWLGTLAFVAAGLVVVGGTLRDWHRQAARRTAGRAAVHPSDDAAGGGTAELAALADAGGLTPAEQRALAARLGLTLGDPSVAEPAP